MVKIKRFIKIEFIETESIQNYIHSVKVSHSMSFAEYFQSCGHYHKRDPEHLHHPQKSSSRHTKDFSRMSTPYAAAGSAGEFWLPAYSPTLGMATMFILAIPVSVRPSFTGLHLYFPDGQQSLTLLHIFMRHMREGILMCSFGRCLFKSSVPCMLGCLFLIDV